MSETVFACGECLRAGRGIQEPVAMPFEMHDGMTGTEWVCPECDVTVSVMYDFGELDLGLVKDSVLNQNNDFEVFPQEPWGH